jgi:hypothetical protein
MITNQRNDGQRQDDFLQKYQHYIIVKDRPFFQPPMDAFVPINTGERRNGRTFFLSTVKHNSSMNKSFRTFDFYTINDKSLYGRPSTKFSTESKIVMAVLLLD